MLKRKLIIAAIVATLPTLAGAQSQFRPVINPEDSGYLGPVQEAVTLNPYQPKALPSRSSSSSVLPVTVNPADSGYHEAVTENPYQGRPAGSRTPLTSKFRPVINPEDSGYLGPVDLVN